MYTYAFDLNRVGIPEALACGCACLAFSSQN